MNRSRGWKKGRWEVKNKSFQESAGLSWEMAQLWLAFASPAEDQSFPVPMPGKSKPSLATALTGSDTPLAPAFMCSYPDMHIKIIRNESLFRCSTNSCPSIKTVVPISQAIYLISGIILLPFLHFKRLEYWCMCFRKVIWSQRIRWGHLN